jgi:hypothetical protein
MLIAVLFAAGLCSASSPCLILGSDLFLAQDLPTTRDLNFTANLKDILDSYRYTQNYSAGSFDCMDTCIIATRVLQEHGYNPSTMASFALKGEEEESHMWLSVSDGLGRFAFIETGAFATGRPVLGEVVDEEKSGNYSSGYVLVSPMKVLECFGYSEERFLSHLGAVERTSAGPIIVRPEKKTRRGQVGPTSRMDRGWNIGMEDRE